VQFNNQSSANATSFAWTFPGGTPASSTETSPTVTWTQPGTYTVTLVATNAGGSNTSTSTITVNTAPTPGFTTQTAGLSVILTNTSSNASTYFWDFGDGTNSTETSPVHNYLQPGSYDIILKATNNCGSSADTIVLEILGAPPVAAFNTAITQGCAPFTVTFNDQSAGSPTAWSWNFQGGFPSTSNVQNPTVTYGTPGTYSVMLQVTNAYGANTATSTNYITVQALPQSVGFTYISNAGLFTFSNQSQNATSFNWTFGDGGTSTDANPVHTYTAQGTYTVTLTALNNCGAITIQQVVNVVLTGTNDLGWLDQFRLYPNPNDGVFTVEMTGPKSETVSFSLYNAIGQLIQTEKADFGAGTLKHAVHYGNLPAAVYTLRVQSGEKSAYVKVAIQ
jgi:PKD repeat protein